MFYESNYESRKYPRPHVDVNTDRWLCCRSLSSSYDVHNYRCFHVCFTSPIMRAENTPAPPTPPLRPPSPLRRRLSLEHLALSLAQPTDMSPAAAQISHNLPAGTLDLVPSCSCMHREPCKWAHLFLCLLTCHRPLEIPLDQAYE